jgi:HSP20 family protein
VLWPDCSALANVGLDDFASFEQRINAYAENNETTEELMEKNKQTTDIVKQDVPRVLSPFSEMERMMEDFMRRPFSMFPMMWPLTAKIEETLSPAIDVFEEDNAVVVKAELPGMKKEDISVELSNGILKIKGEKKREEKVEKKNYYRTERSLGSFERRISLPAETQVDKAKASFKDGLLEIKIPKSEEAKKKQRKINIE